MGSKPSSTGSVNTHNPKQKKLYSAASQHNLKAERVLKQTKSSDYSQQFVPLRCEKLFQHYADSDLPDMMTPDGTRRFFQDLGLSIEDAASMGYISKQEWMTGLESLGADTLEKIRSNEQKFRKVFENPVEFKEMYKYSFNYSKNNQQKCLEVETAIVVWTLLLGERYPLVYEFTRFLQEKEPVKVINRDQWNSFWEFVWCNLEDYDESSAWPVLFDEFVDWKKE